MIFKSEIFNFNKIFKYIVNKNSFLEVGKLIYYICIIYKKVSKLLIYIYDH